MTRLGYIEDQRHSILGRLIALALTLAIVNCAAALDPAKSLSQYVQRTWRANDGLPASLVRTILQTSDGYIWLGTSGGLVRFNGVEFRSFTSSNTEAIQYIDVISLFEDHQGNLWMLTWNDGYSYGLTRYRDGRFYDETKNGFSGRYVFTWYDDGDGNMWLGTQAGLFRYREGKFRAYGTQDGLDGNQVGAIFKDSHKNLLVGNRGGLYRRNGDKFEPYENEDGGLHGPVTFIAENRAGELWVSARGGLKELSPNGKVKNVVDGDFKSVYADPEGRIWAGSQSGDLYQVTLGQVVHYGAKEGLPRGKIVAILQDKNGSLWVGTGGMGYVVFPPASLALTATPRRRVLPITIRCLSTKTARATCGLVLTPRGSLCSGILQSRLILWGKINLRCQSTRTATGLCGREHHPG